MEKKNIYQRMLDIENEAGVIQKDLEIELSKTRSYKAVSDSSVKRIVNPLLFKHGVKFIPRSIEVLESKVITTEREYSGKKVITEQEYIRLKVKGHYFNVDNPSESEVVEGIGEGLDSGDKAAGKAETYAIKRCHIKAFNLISDDDTDNHASPERVVKGITTQENQTAIDKLKLYVKNNTKDMQSYEIVITNSLAKHGYTKIDELDFNKTDKALFLQTLNKEIKDIKQSQQTKKDEELF